MIRHRVRIRFTKEGDLRWLGHRELARAWDRVLRRAGVNVRMSQGFHPRPRVNFPSALAVGVAGLDEVVELDLTDDREPMALAARIAPHCPDGLNLRSVEAAPSEGRAAQVARMTFECPVEERLWREVAERIERVMASESLRVDRGPDRAAVDIRPWIEDLTLREGGLRMRIRATREGSARPREVLSALGLDRLEEEGRFLTRTQVELES